MRLQLDQLAAFSAIPRETVIGIMYAMALVASLLLGDKLCGGGAYVTKTLAGSMLWVTWPLVIVTTVVYILILIFDFKFHQKFIDLSENPSSIKNKRFWDFLLFVTQGVITIWILVLIASLVGLLFAYYFDFSIGPAIAMFLGYELIIVGLIGKLQQTRGVNK